MRKIVFVFLFFSFIFTLISCTVKQPAKSNEIQEKDNSVIAENNNAKDDESPAKENIKTENYDIYQLTMDGDPFSVAIAENPIDADYNKELLESDLNPEIQKKYLDIWTEELNASVDRLAAKLSEADKEIFHALQKDWESSVTGTLAFEKSILTNKEYGMQASSSFSYLLLSERRNCYRERTISVKYLIYLLDLPNAKGEVYFKYMSEHS